MTTEAPSIVYHVPFSHDGVQVRLIARLLTTRQRWAISVDPQLGVVCRLSDWTRAVTHGVQWKMMDLEARAIEAVEVHHKAVQLDEWESLIHGGENEGQ